MSRRTRWWVEHVFFAAVFGACAAGLFALYNVVGISTSGGRAGVIVIMPTSIVALATQLSVRRRLRQRFAPNEPVEISLKDLGK